MAFGKPIVQFFTQEGDFSAGAAAVSIKENKIELFADEIVRLLHDPDTREKMGKAGKKRIDEALKWDLQKVNLKCAYTSLFKR